MNFERKRIATSRLDTSYVEFEGDGPPALLLHGATGHALQFAPWVRRTSLPFRFIAPDQRGHGQSGRPATGYAALDLGQDASAFCDALGLESIVVIGASMGGNAAMALAALCPDLVSAVVLSDPAFRIPEAAIVQAELNLSPPPTFNDFASVKAALGSRLLPYPDEDLQLALGENLRTREDGRLEWRWSSDALKQVHQHFRDNLAGLGGRVTVPTLILQAGERRILPDDAAADLHRAIPMSRLVVIEGAGHAIQATHPTEFDEAIHSFLTSEGLL